MRAALVRIGATAPVRLRSSFAGRGPQSLRRLVAGTIDPAIARWRNVGTALEEEDTSFAESTQGVATDGRRWFVVSNRQDHPQVHVYALGGELQDELRPASALLAMLHDRHDQLHTDEDLHFGAPTWARETLLVPTQRPDGIWVISNDLRDQDWWADPSPAARFSWVALEPGSGLLYTSRFDTPSDIEAVEWETLRRRPADIEE